MARPRFEGAVTTPEAGGEIADQSIVPAPTRPDRPILVEVAAAILIVGGLTSLIGSLAAPGIIAVLLVALNVLMVVLGVLIRRGQAWLIAVNVVAVALFVELTALPSGFAIIFSLLDAVVLVALIRYRSWFDWRVDGVPAEDDGA